MQEGVGPDDVRNRVIEPLFGVWQSAVAEPVNPARPGILVSLTNGKVSLDLVSLAARQVTFEVHGESGIASLVPEPDPFGISSASASVSANHGRPSSRGWVSPGCCVVGKDPGRVALVVCPFIEKGAETLGGASFCLVDLGRLEKGLEIPHDASFGALSRRGQESKQEQGDSQFVHGAFWGRDFPGTRDGYLLWGL